MSIKLDLEPFVVGGIKLERPFIIAGPCSAESEEQVLSTARQLAGLEYGFSGQEYGNPGPVLMHLKVSVQKDWHG